MDKKSIIIVVLLFFVIASGGGLYFLMKKNSDMETKFEAYQNVIVASRNIEVGEKIENEDLATVSLQKRSIPFKILVASEIVGKFALMPIYKDEPFRAEKIAAPEEYLSKEEESVSLKFLPKYDIYNMSLAQFRNPNYLLSRNESIDIIAVVDSGGEMVVNIIAQNVKIVGFTSKGVEQKSALEVVEPKSTAKDPNPAPINRYADELLLDLDEDRIKKIVEATNKGNQFWMIWDHNSKKEVLKNIREENQDKEITLKEGNLTMETSSERAIERVETVYIPRYQNVVTKNRREATISFENRDEVQKYSVLGLKDPLGCEKFIEIDSRYANIREEPNLNSKVLFQARRGDIIGFEKYIGEYYELCDGRYIHSSIATEVGR